MNVGIGNDVSKGTLESNKERWFTTAPVAPEESRQDTVTVYDVVKNSDGIASCSIKEK